MKKIVLFFVLITLNAFSQSPPMVNYQGIARNAAGVPIINQNIGIKFELLQGSASGAVVYTEQQVVTTNSLGLFNTQIGASNPLIGINWQNGPYFLQIGLDAAGGTSYTFLGTQQLVSVPYALFAQKAASAPSPTVAYVGNILSVGGNTTTINASNIPNGVRDGQTLRWDSLAQVWKNSNNLINDESRVSIGLFPNEIKSKFHATTSNPLDSSAIAALHINAQSGQAAIKSVILGSTPSNSVNPYSTSIFGTQSSSNNNGGGFGVGSFNYGASNNTGIGVIGIGNGKANSAIAIGVYGTTDQNGLTNTRYAGLFDKGGVLVNDSLLLGNATNPGSVGDVLTRSSTGRAKWQSPPINTGPFTNSANYIHAAPSFTNNRILFGIPFSGSIGYNSRVTIVNPAGIPSDTALIVVQKNTTKPAIYASILPSNTSTNPAVFGEVIGGINGTTAGVYGKATNNHGVIGRSVSFNGVWGESDGGVGVSGLSTQTGQAGRFLLQGASSGFPSVYIATNSNPPALKAETFANGSAIEAVNSTTAGGASHNALRLIDGHISTTQTVTGFGVAAVGYNFSIGSTGSTDVAGTLQYINGLSTIPTAGTGTINVSFSKSYPSKPVVVVSATSNEWAQTSYFVQSSVSGFSIIFKNNTAATINLTTLTDAFSYHIIGVN